MSAPDYEDGVADGFKEGEAAERARYRLITEKELAEALGPGLLIDIRKQLGALYRRRDGQ